ncbi:coiled-coil domain-containing protein R3HCC1L [Notolabrus celidotus]|uniref:coiled-coil domain-containing protein R3HCC1L n=1 Tax=Notolabrus celidotus TaxID=1203425 RepID=UPI0014906D88|nr:coiled-coil domain-containing protein R3HCC1L [Notolabrus celidotus]
MELDQPKEDCAPAQPAPETASQKPGQALNVPKKRPQDSKDKAQTQGEVKPRPRPRYTDKSRKNAKNKKDKAGALENGAPAAGGEGGDGVQEGDGKPDVKEEWSQDTANGHPDLPGVEGDAASQPETTNLEEEKGEEESWDTLFNDDGDCLDPLLLEELALKEGKKKGSIQQPEFDYYNTDRYVDDDEDDIDLTEDELANIVEIYDFPAEFKTEDLLKLFQEYQQRGFDIKWIDDKHALGLFSSPLAAGEALRTRHPLMKLRPLSKSSSAIKAEARSCSDYLLPAKERPQTSAVLARKLVMGALGVKSNQTKEQRDAEKRKLQDAKDQKRLAAKQKEDAWEGK